MLSILVRVTVVFDRISQFEDRAKDGARYFMYREQFDSFDISMSRLKVKTYYRIAYHRATANVTFLL